MRKREPLLIHMQILGSLFESPKGRTRLAQAVGIHYNRAGVYMDLLLAKGLIREAEVDGQKVLTITDLGYTLYQDWLEIWTRLPIGLT